MPNDEQRYQHQPDDDHPLRSEGHSGSRSLQLRDDKGPNGDVFLHVDQQLGEEPRALVCLQLANAGDTILVGEVEDVEEEGADFRTKGVDPLAETALGRPLIHPLTLRRLFGETARGTTLKGVVGDGRNGQPRGRPPTRGVVEGKLVQSSSP